MRSESGSVKCARVKVTFKNAIKCFPYHVPKPREPFGGLRAGRLTISPTGPSDASPIACSLTYLPEHPLTAPAPGTGRATAASHWMKAKRCVQANLWQGSLSAVAREARHQITCPPVARPLRDTKGDRACHRVEPSVAPSFGDGETVRAGQSVARRKGGRWICIRDDPDNAATGSPGRAGFSAEGSAHGA